MEMLRSRSGALILNDAYNANPTSMAAALDTLASLPATGRRIAVMGPMAELDDDGPKRHRDMGDYARSLGLQVIAVGTGDYGTEPVNDPVSAIGHLEPNEAVLVKGSRVAGLEKVAQLLAAR
jgi:UDP-N-acetylmuramoyl-tripeptide--D-alanyl-D-alanine ligase